MSCDQHSNYVLMLFCALLTSFCANTRASDQLWCKVERETTGYDIWVDADTSVVGKPLEYGRYEAGDYHSIRVIPSDSDSSYLLEVAYAAQTAKLLAYYGHGQIISPSNYEQTPTIRIDNMGNTYSFNALKDLGDYPPLTARLDDFQIRKEYYNDCLTQAILQPARYKQQLESQIVQYELGKRLKQGAKLGLSDTTLEIVSGITETYVIEETEIVVYMTESERGIFASQIREIWDVQKYPNASGWLEQLNTTAGLWQALGQIGLNVVQYTMYETLVMYPECEQRMNVFGEYLSNLSHRDPALHEAFAEFQADFLRMKANYGNNLYDALVESIDLEVSADLAKFGVKLIEKRVASLVGKEVASALGCIFLVVDPLLGLFEDLDMVNVATMAGTIHFEMSLYFDDVQSYLQTTPTIAYGDMDNLSSLYSMYSYTGYLVYHNLETFVTTDLVELAIDTLTFNLVTLFKASAIAIATFAQGAPDPGQHLHDLALDALSY